MVKAAQRPTSYLQRFDPDHLEGLVREAKDWAQINGMGIRTSEQPNSSDVLQIAPFTLLPSVTPKQLFVEALNLEKSFNEMYHRIAMDYEFMTAALRNVVKTDEFTRRLFDIYSRVMDEKRDERFLVLNVQRSDYMFDTDPTSSESTLKQVEVNNIAAGLPALSVVCSRYHRKVLRDLGYMKQEVECVLPAMKPVNSVSEGLANAWKAYGVAKAVVLFVIEDVSRNICDQRLVEYQLVTATNDEVRVLRMPLNDCYDQLRLDEAHEKRLYVRSSGAEVAVVYFRAGYVPQQYVDPHTWEARLMIERSKAIKCPWIGFHLVGTKKVQQLMTKPENLKLFVQSDTLAERMQSTFVRICGLDQDDSGTEAVLKEVLSHPENYVLKPQLEGGGNNIYGRDIVDALANMDPASMERFVVMQRLRPRLHHNYLVTYNKPVCLSEVVSELGIFGVNLASNAGIIQEYDDEYLLRTKLSHLNEGSFMTGAAALDTPYFSISAI